MRFKVSARLLAATAGLAMTVVTLLSCQQGVKTEEPGAERGLAQAGRTVYGHDSSKEYFEAPEAKALKTKGELMGRDIWFKATAGNERFHMYAIGQRVGDHNMNFWAMLANKGRARRFNNWGLINDPDCCTPGTSGCPAKSLNETYGMDYCPGDQELLKYVGNPDAEKLYKDPACDMPSWDGSGLQSACDLKFGTSTGAVGFRKFPNPRFDRQKWLAVKGNSMDSWEGYNRQINDGSIEPPFRIGISCASCHVSFDPRTPPADPNNPKWSQLSGTVGNQYMYSGQVFGSGFKHDSLEWQMLTNSRPGAVDTSAVPNDQVNNPSTINAIINFTKRPVFKEMVNTWRRVGSCSGPAEKCWCNETKSRCYEKSLKNDEVLHVLKGGEDSVGKEHAVLRVYVNIGSCSEQCWLNNLTDLRATNKTNRNFGQRPFDIGQCRRDCPNFRALEDRVEGVRDFLLAGNTFDLKDAKKMSTNEELIDYVEMDRKYGQGAVARGQGVYAQTCARCHSSQKDSLESRDFLAKDATGRRIDWLGSDERINADEVGTFECRAFHSNHQAGHIWEQYGSEEYRKQAPVRNLSQEATNGIGHYRAISLLNVWAFAPFMHNNALGPEICGRKQGGHTLNVTGYNDCQVFDPSVDGRLKLYEESMAALLNPSTRGKKETLTSSDIRIPMTPPMFGINKDPQAFTLVIPKGIAVSRLGGFRHKDFIADLKDGLNGIMTFNRIKATPQQRAVAKGFMSTMVKSLLKSKKRDIVLDASVLDKMGTAYSNCLDKAEDKGHTFGEKLSDQEKKDLTAFMMTL